VALHAKEMAAEKTSLYYVRYRNRSPVYPDQIALTAGVNVIHREHFSWQSRFEKLRNIGSVISSATQMRRNFNFSKDYMAYKRKQ